MSEQATLWAIHSRGPDDIYPAVDYDDAVRVCDLLLRMDREHASDPHWPMCSALPMIWPGTPQEHAEYLVKFGVVAPADVSQVEPRRAGSGMNKETSHDQ
jgi:hypothetical protein